MPSFYPENNRILPSDDSNRTLHKIASLLGAGSGGSSGSGSSGITAMQVYMNRAPADPDNINIAAVSYDETSGSIQQWNVNSLSWV